MRIKRQNSQTGQALLLFALIFPVVLAILALVIDVGWANYVVKKAQMAADSAALAAASKAALLTTSDGSVDCTRVACQAASACPSSGNLQTGCLYAAANGFSSGGESSQQSVRISGGVDATAPDVPNVPVDYWVQVETKQTLPQWFSGMFNNFGLRPSARSTAALRKVAFNVSIDLLNRSSDCFVSLVGLGLVCGEDFLAVGGNTIQSEGGIYMSSANG